ncbi:MAG: hypothetical protein HZA70_05405 [Planctomycetes bacterium]|nr:hypothetical protein [Planctomycetota bacterium]
MESIDCVNGHSSDTVNHVGFTAGVHGRPCTPRGAWQSLDSIKSNFQIIRRNKH